MTIRNGHRYRNEVGRGKFTEEPNPDGRSGKQTSLGSPFSSRTFEKLCIRANLVREEGPSFHEAFSRANMAEETRNAVFGRVPKFPVRTYIFHFPV